MSCIDVVPGCADCAAEAAYTDTTPHECHELCEMWRKHKAEDEEFHRLTHEPIRCENCNVVLNDHRSPWRELSRICPSGLCSQWYCPDCGVTQSSAGPIDCPICGSIGRRPSVTKMRRLYRRRHRYW